ncbi:hypothetical protein KA005_83805, partial [bacterium]|nr:hypothetical protein [bacterium]
MVHRICVSCPGCDETCTLRISVGRSPEQPFYFVCSSCNTATKGKLLITDEGITIELEEGEVRDLELDTNQLYTIDPILPILSTARSMDDKGGSPFLFTFQILGERSSEYSMRVSGYYDFLENRWLRLRRLTRFFLDSNWDRFDPLLMELWNNSIENLNSIVRYDAFYRLYDLMMTSMFVYPLHIEMRREWNDFFLPSGVHAQQIADYQDTIITDPEYLQNKESLFNCIAQYVELGDALIPGMVVDLYPQDHASYGDLRIYRDNFTELRDLYIQCFEACTQSLTFIIEIVNVVNRGNPHDYSPQPEIGRLPNNRTQFNRLTAEDKTYFLRELPIWVGCWASTLDRQLRNKIGHRQIHH